MLYLEFVFIFLVRCIVSSVERGQQWIDTQLYIFYIYLIFAFWISRNFLRLLSLFLFWLPIYFEKFLNPRYRLIDTFISNVRLPGWYNWLSYILSYQLCKPFIFIMCFILNQTWKIAIYDWAWPCIPFDEIKLTCH